MAELKSPLVGVLVESTLDAVVVSSVHDTLRAAVLCFLVFHTPLSLAKPALWARCLTLFLYCKSTNDITYSVPCRAALSISEWAQSLP